MTFTMVFSHDPWEYVHPLVWPSVCLALHLSASPSIHQILVKNGPGGVWSSQIVAKLGPKMAELVPKVDIQIATLGLKMANLGPIMAKLRLKLAYL